MRNKQLFLVSHTGGNKGTVDFFCDYLNANNHKYYLLQHPFSTAPTGKTCLFYCDGIKRKITKEFNRPKSEVLALIQQMIINFYVVLLYGRRTSIIIGFGGFNIFSAICLRKIFGYKSYFWGVDYSSYRFENVVLNKLYFFFENIGSRYSELVMQPTQSAEDIRIKKHDLDKSRSLVIPNGVHMLNKLNNIEDTKTAFVYIGAMTSQHGILKLLEKYYASKLVNTQLYIYGVGEHAKKIEMLIKENSLGNIVHYMGYMKMSDIVKSLNKSGERFIGIAPYERGDFVDHAEYGDSLKIKEYIMLGIPYLTSDVVTIPKDLRKFGVIYNDANIQIILQNPAKINALNAKEIDKILSGYTWEYLCSKIPLK